jgi:hypothetical protein
MEVRRSGAFLARRTRTMKLCSSDARNGGQPRPLPLIDVWSRGGIGLDRAGGVRLSRKECSQYSECPHFLSILTFSFDDVDSPFFPSALL